MMLKARVTQDVSLVSSIGERLGGVRSREADAIGELRLQLLSAPVPSVIVKSAASLSLRKSA